MKHLIQFFGDQGAGICGSFPTHKHFDLKKKSLLKPTSHQFKIKEVTTNPKLQTLDEIIFRNPKP